MTRFSIITLCLIGALVSGTAAWSDEDGAAGNTSIADAKQKIASRLDGIGVEDIRETPIPGILEVAVGAQVAYVSTDGRYLVKGEIIDMSNGHNVTEMRRAEARAKTLAELDDEFMIVFSPNVDPKHTITIFTDVDCSYCRKLHSEIDELMALGVRVQYLLYPRYGKQSPAGEPMVSWAKAENVWCSDDRNSALTRAKLGEEVTAEPCATPIDEHYAMGQMVGFSGTPAIVTENGDLIAGYLPAPRLVERLDALAALK